MTSLKTTLDEVAAAVATGDFQTAVSLSGDALAHCDARWTEALNSHTDTSDAIADSMLAGTAHVDALAHSGQTAEALSTAVLLLTQDAIDPSQNSEVIPGRVRLLCMSVEAVDSLMQATPPDDFVKEHAMSIVTSLGSMLYVSYNQLRQSMPEGPIVNDAYALLSQLRKLGAVQWPNVTIGTETIDAADRGRLLGDIIGRLRALEWLSC